MTTVSNINGSLFSGLSAVDGRTLSTLAAVDGQTIVAGGPPATNLWAWYEPSREIGYVNNDPINPLTDQTGNGRNWTQATSGSRPLYDTSDALNGLAVASFATTKFWTGPDASALGTGGATNAGQTLQGHIFIVVKAATATAELWNFSSSGGSEYYPFGTNIYESALIGGRIDNIPPGVSLNAWRVYEIQMKCSTAPGAGNGTIIINIDGSAIHSESGSGTIGAAWPSAPTLGKGQDGNFLNAGFVAGLYLYSQQLTGATTPTRAAVISYINTRFALSSS